MYRPMIGLGLGCRSRPYEFVCKCPIIGQSFYIRQSSYVTPCSRFRGAGMPSALLVLRHASVM